MVDQKYFFAYPPFSKLHCLHFRFPSVRKVSYLLMILAVFEDVTQREKNIILGGAAGPSGIRIFQPPFDMDTKVVAWKKGGTYKATTGIEKSIQ